MLIRLTSVSPSLINSAVRWAGIPALGPARGIPYQTRIATHQTQMRTLSLTRHPNAARDCAVARICGPARDQGRTLQNPQKGCARPSGPPEKLDATGRRCDSALVARTLDATSQTHLSLVADLGLVYSRRPPGNQDRWDRSRPPGVALGWAQTALPRVTRRCAPGSTLTISPTKGLVGAPRTRNPRRWFRRE